MEKKKAPKRQNILTKAIGRIKRFGSKDFRKGKETKDTEEDAFNLLDD